MFNRGILGRQTKCIPAHRLHYIATLMTLVTIDDIAQGVVANMAHMQATAGVREHRQAVEFFPGALVVTDKTLIVLPIGLRAALHLLGVVNRIHG